MPTQETIEATPVSTETTQPTPETIEAKPLKPISAKAFQSALTRIVAGEELLDKLFASYDLTAEQIALLNEARNTFLNSQK
jgi:hypothetical protein